MKAKYIVSLVILCVIGIQGFISLLLLPLSSKKIKDTWPFLNFPMYREAHREGDLISNIVVIGVRADGSEFDIKRGDLGIGSWIYRDFANTILLQQEQMVDDFMKLASPALVADCEFLRVVNRGAIFQKKRFDPVLETELGVIELK